jgi:sarcosine oxidase subunit gamma
LQQRFGIELPDGPRRTIAGELSLLGVAPCSWVAMYEQAGNAFAASLHESVGDLAAVADQSDGYAVLHLSGTNVRHALARLLPLDVHPRVLRVGNVATSIVGRMSVTIWRLEDDATGSSVFGTSIFRSLAASYWQALRESVADAGRGDS